MLIPHRKTRPPHAPPRPDPTGARPDALVPEPSTFDASVPIYSWVGIIKYLPTDEPAQRAAITAAFRAYKRAAETKLWPRYGAVEHWAKIEAPTSADELEDARARLARRFPLAEVAEAISFTFTFTYLHIYILCTAYCLLHTKVVHIRSSLMLLRSVYVFMCAHALVYPPPQRVCVYVCARACVWRRVRARGEMASPRGATQREQTKSHPSSSVAVSRAAARWQTKSKTKTINSTNLHHRVASLRPRASRSTRATFSAAHTSTH